MVKSPLTNTIAEFEISLDYNQIVSGYKKEYGIDVAAYFKNKKANIYRDKKNGYRFYYPLDLAGNGHFYEQLEKYDWYYMDWKWEHQRALKYIGLGDRVLEIGCGKGSFLQKLNGMGIESVGLELNRGALGKAKQKGLTVFGKDVEKYAGNNASKFDVVCSFQVMEHIGNIGNVLKASVRLLKKNGRLIISVPNNDNLVFRYGNILLNQPPHHMGMWSESSLINLAEILGVKVLKIEKEVLQEYHQQLYCSVLCQKITTFYPLQRILLLLMSPIVKIFRKYITGLTIMAVYENI